MLFTQFRLCLQTTAEGASGPGSDDKLHQTGASYQICGPGLGTSWETRLQERKQTCSVPQVCLGALLLSLLPPYSPHTHPLSPKLQSKAMFRETELLNLCLQTHSSVTQKDTNIHSLYTGTCIQRQAPETHTLLWG